VAVPGDPWAVASARHAARTSVDKVRVLAISTGDRWKGRCGGDEGEVAGAMYVRNGRLTAFEILE